MQLSINNVSMRFGPQILFEDVNATFVSGWCYAITGLNGAGKSTSSWGMRDCGKLCRSVKPFTPRQG